MNARVLTLLVLVAVGALCFLAFFLMAGGSDSQTVTASAEAESEHADPPSVSLTAMSDERRSVEPEVRTEDEVSRPEPIAPEETPAVEEADLEAKTSIQIRVVDPDGLPIEGATLRLWAMRSQNDPGSHYLYRGEAPTAVTDHCGLATLDHWVWVHLDGKTGEVTLAASHEDFVPFEGDVEIGTEVREITMQWGATVVVSAWYEDPARTVREIDIQVDRNAGLPRTAWKVEADGSLRTNRLSIGSHRIRVEHESEALGRLYSAVRDFELATGDWLELDLELVPAARFEGELDPRVPRPIVNGNVQVCIQGDGPLDQRACLYREFEAAIEADGSFVFEALPPGRGQLIALCEGWVSELTPLEPDPPLDAGEVPAPENVDYEAPRISVPQWAVPYVVAMEPTGTIEIEVLDEKGSPLPGAMAGASPNVYFIGVGSSIFPWREWNAETDEAGIAVIADLPPEPSLWVHAGSKTHRMRKEDRENTPAIEVRSGETTRITLKLEPKD